MRCVSLLPSATEVIKEVATYCASPDDLQLIGRSHECDFPPEVEALPALTASKIKVGAECAGRVWGRSVSGRWAADRRSHWFTACVACLSGSGAQQWDREQRMG